MPPTRTVPPAKAIKTERTHEENQERAYIAASRRSDRSLEARVESARRASEIHKRRTGRSLKVTEQDVINEEMYEEEDDDLPMQYRRLTAHLQTNSADFNRRLNAYLTNQVAMRSALGQGIINAYAQDFQQNPQFANQPYFPSPMIAHQQQQQTMQPSMQPPMQQPSSPSMQRHAPYPSPRTQQQGFQPQHNRSASIAVPQQASRMAESPIIPSENERRASMPAVKTEVKTESPDDMRSTPSSTATPTPRPSFPQGSFSQNPYNQVPQNNYNMPAFGGGFNAFSMQLPQETQQMLYGSGMPNDPYWAAMMQGSNNLPLPANTFNPSMQATTEVGKGQQMYPSVNGLNSTLGVAPSDLDMSKNFAGNLDFSNDPTFFDQAVNPLSDEATPGGTPGVGGEPWSNYIDTERWDAPTSSQ
ncbi:hypothetical protein D0Z07_6971 [Hyphodiscus hymeniophilus]|uniref:Uncharacterized protein n=1 Tax=Hyphodiscus hymeniophilus TaxID=353542 RepID=A0A9P6VFZ7_9HELO|nr:hypothetical protein D0Z07_6971 [Hyphodiscus hymeniophilus]